MKKYMIERKIPGVHTMNDSDLSGAAKTSTRRSCRRPRG